MGADPKPSKRRKQTSAPLPMVRPEQAPPVPPAGRLPSLPGSAGQTRLPSGPDYERPVTVPTIPQLLEQSLGVDPDGYYKFTTGDDGKSWFLAYRWKLGEWAGHYCMVRVLRGELAFGITLLAEKVHQVRAGIRRPTLDRYGD